MTWLVLAALALAYTVAARRSTAWPPRLTLAWIAGLAILAAALTGPVDAAADRLLSMHMVQHQLVALLAAPLLVLAAPVRLMGLACGREVRRELGRVLTSRPVRVLTRPSAGLATFAVVLALVHVPGVYGAAVRSDALHALEHAALFWSAVALWVPLLAPRPLPRRAGGVGVVGVLLGAMGAMGALGAFLAGTDEVVYPVYAGRSADPVADQHLAGGLMWVGGMAVVLPALLLLAWRALAEEERRQRVREAAR